jgi:excisionase family DNA binding protein
MSQLLTIDDAASTLGTQPRFIRHLIAERRIPYVKLGRHVRIHQTDLDPPKPERAGTSCSEGS